MSCKGMQRVSTSLFLACLLLGTVAGAAPEQRQCEPNEVGFWEGQDWVVEDNSCRLRSSQDIVNCTKRPYTILLVGDSIDRFTVQHNCATFNFSQPANYLNVSAAEAAGDQQKKPNLYCKLGDNVTLAHFFIFGAQPYGPYFGWLDNANLSSHRYPSHPNATQLRLNTTVKDILGVLSQPPDLVVFSALIWDVANATAAGGVFYNRTLGPSDAALLEELWRTYSSGVATALDTLRSTFPTAQLGLRTTLGYSLPDQANAARSLLTAQYNQVLKSIARKQRLPLFEADVMAGVWVPPSGAEDPTGSTCRERVSLAGLTMDGLHQQPHVSAAYLQLYLNYAARQQQDGGLTCPSAGDGGDGGVPGGGGGGGEPPAGPPPLCPPPAAPVPPAQPQLLP